MNLVSNIKRILLEDLALQIQQLKDKYVGEGKPMSEKDFEKIQEVSGGKFNNIAWLSKKVGTGIIKNEDIYKYKEYFEIFEKNKKKFTHKDLNLYRTAEDLALFLDEVVKTREGDIVYDEIKGKNNYVTQNDIEKLVSSGGIKYLGIYDNKDYKYQVFQVFHASRPVWKLYRDILGRCKGRGRGAKIDICTIGDYDYFRDYLKDDKGSSYFVLFNLDDPKSPYQLHYESGQFMDKNDREKIGIDQLKFFEFVGDKVPRYSLDRMDFPGMFDLPIRGKGTRDERGRKQGLWRNYEDGYLQSIQTFVNGKLNGPFVSYYENGKIESKGTLNDGSFVGEYEEYNSQGTLMEKGVFGPEGKIGIWFLRDALGVQQYVNYDESPPKITGLTKNGLIRFVSDFQGDEPRGNMIIFNKSGSVNAMGRIGVDTTPLGEWIFYQPDGSIKSQGKFLRGRRSGQWTDVITLKDKSKRILTSTWLHGFIDGKIKVYNLKGEFIAKVSQDKIKPRDWWKFIPSLSSFTNNRVR